MDDKQNVIIVGRVAGKLKYREMQDQLLSCADIGFTKAYPGSEVLRVVGDTNTDEYTRLLCVVEAIDGGGDEDRLLREYLAATDASGDEWIMVIGYDVNNEPMQHRYRARFGESVAIDEYERGGHRAVFIAHDKHEAYIDIMHVLNDPQYGEEDHGEAMDAVIEKHIAAYRTGIAAGLMDIIIVGRIGNSGELSILRVQTASVEQSLADFTNDCGPILRVVKPDDGDGEWEAILSLLDGADTIRIVGGVAIAEFLERGSRTEATARGFVSAEDLEQRVVALRKELTYDMNHMITAKIEHAAEIVETDILKAKRTIEYDIRDLQTRMKRPVIVTVPKSVYALILAGLSIVAAVSLMQTAPTPVINNQPADVRVTIDADDVVHQMSANRMQLDPNTGTLFTMPEAVEGEEEISEWRRACVDVCGAEHNWHSRFPLTRVRGGAAPREVTSRVLVNDPETQTCTCLTNNMVIRRVGWRRAR